MHVQGYTAPGGRLTPLGPYRALMRPLGVRAHACIFLLCVFFALGVHLPGQIPYDGITVWYEARNAVHFSQHPPALALIWRWTDILTGGPAGLAALQIILLWLPAFLLVHWTRAPTLPAVFFYALLLTWPVFFAAVSFLVKDVLGAHLLLLAGVIGLVRPGRTTPGQTIAALSIACIAALVRYQFALVVIILLAAIVWKNRREGGHAARLLASGLTSALGTAALVSLLTMLTFTPTVRDSPDPQSSLRKIMVFDIAGVLSQKPAAALTVFEDHGVDIGALKAKNNELFTAYRVDTLWEPGGVFAMLAGVSNTGVLAQWVEVARHSPGALLAHRGASFSRLLGLHDVYKCWPTYSGFSATPQDLASALGAASYAPSPSAAVIKDRLFPSGSFIFRPWIYAAGALALLALAFQGRAPFAAGVLATSGLLYELTFLLAPQACDVRYSYFMMTATAFSAALTVFHGMARRPPAPTPAKS